MQNHERWHKVEIKIKKNKLNRAMSLAGYIEGIGNSYFRYINDKNERYHVKVERQKIMLHLDRVADDGIHYTGTNKKALKREASRIRQKLNEQIRSEKN